MNKKKITFHVIGVVFVGFWLAGTPFGVQALDFAGTGCVHPDSRRWVLHADSAPLLDPGLFGGNGPGRQPGS